MKTIVMASLDKNAGKTSLIIGLAKALGQPCAYLKPFGDRLLYRKKRQWDYDAALVTSVLGIKEIPEYITLGFDHSKLRFMYDEASLKARLTETAASLGQPQVLFLEAGKDPWYGASVGLDAISLARHLAAPLVFVLSGNSDAFADGVRFIERRLKTEGVKVAGVIANKVPDLDEFAHLQQETLGDLTVPVLGVVPYVARLTHVSVRFLADQLFAKVIAGEEGLARTVDHYFVGSLPPSATARASQLIKESTLVVTSGERSDVLLATLDANPAGIVLTGQVLPAANIAAKANDRGIPLLLVAQDLSSVSRQLDQLDPLISKEETPKLDLLAQLVKDHVTLDVFAK